MSDAKRTTLEDGRVVEPVPARNTNDRCEVCDLRPGFSKECCEVSCAVEEHDGKCVKWRLVEPAVPDSIPYHEVGKPEERKEVSLPCCNVEDPGTFGEPSPPVKPTEEPVVPDRIEYHDVGDVFEIDGVRLEVHRGAGCLGCYFKALGCEGYPQSQKMMCSPDERKDGASVRYRRPAIAVADVVAVVREFKPPIETNRNDRDHNVRMGMRAACDGILAKLEPSDEPAANKPEPVAEDSVPAPSAVERIRAKVRECRASTTANRKFCCDDVLITIENLLDDLPSEPDTKLVTRLRASVIERNRQILTLRAENAQQAGDHRVINEARDAENERLRREKAARVYYQTIVYEVCNVLDGIEGGSKIVCGTVETPTTEVQVSMKRVQEQLVDADAKAQARNERLYAKGVERNQQICELRDANAGLARKVADLLCSGEHINHAIWPDPDAGHDTGEAPAAIAQLQRQLASAKKNVQLAVQCNDRQRTHISELVSELETLRAIVTDRNAAIAIFQDIGDTRHKLEKQLAEAESRVRALEASEQSLMKVNRQLVADQADTKARVKAEITAMVREERPGDIPIADTRSMSRGAYHGWQAERGFADKILARLEQPEAEATPQSDSLTAMRLATQARVTAECNAKFAAMVRELRKCFTNLNFGSATATVREVDKLLAKLEPSTMTGREAFEKAENGQEVRRRGDHSASMGISLNSGVVAELPCIEDWDATDWEVVETVGESK